MEENETPPSDTTTLSVLPSEVELFHTLLDNMPDAIYFKDLKSRFLKVNKYWTQKIGVKDLASVEGKTDFDFFTSEHARQAFNDEQALIKTGKPIVGIEEKETWSDRPDTWVSTTKMPIVNGEGTIVGTFGLSRDITEIKKYRDALQEAKDELEQRVMDRTAELSEAKFRLEQHLEQLKFLNLTSFALTQITSIEQMFCAIGKAFLARFPHGHISLCQFIKGSIKSVYADGLLIDEDVRQFCVSVLSSFSEAELQQSRLIENWTTDKRFLFAWPQQLLLETNWICIPLLVDKKSLAVVQIFAPIEGRQIFDQEQDMLHTLAAHAATCLSNAFHYKSLEIKARMEGELEAARNIQQSLMPQGTPLIPRISIGGLYLPAYEVGGDYLDYFQCGDGSWVVFVADVCGKGVPAALLMTVLRSIARVESRTNFTAKALLCAVNHSMVLNINERSFITALCLVINPCGTSMTYARAGQSRLLKIPGHTSCVETVDCDGIALGIIQEPDKLAEELEEVTLPLVTGDIYLAYTDGLNEATNELKDPFGLPRLYDSMVRYQEKNAEEMVSAIHGDLKEFTHGQPSHDDLTIVVMKVTGLLPD